MATKMRYIRVEETLWRKAIRKTKADGTTVSELIRNFLSIYTEDDE